ncbi:putative amino acid transporter aATP11 [Leptomonas pyrrhocoris]|uniref:Putative amino acid transporter aATP11 n=1 Tax=Leptomonas pyrrhocoris TaxID=157538 RepID=A0A0M9FQB8_LEPPY|nr:putative amino acid transporter aATP11 [Leptomonas pyrrhocoris]KPA73905.1 putative amino acid transporter aATP11 [Leptomonas pyrrhocoris]|eukprot:XP_015652344.1 putative amino acid transporter aATP11 [Leptomonas pyrrhocoris]
MPGHREPTHSDLDDDLELQELRRPSSGVAQATTDNGHAVKGTDLADDLYSSGSNSDLDAAPKKADKDEKTSKAEDTTRSPPAGSEDKDYPSQRQRNIFVRVVQTIIPNGGLLSGVFNLASVTLGAGIMSIPSSLNTSGLIMGIVYLVIITALTVFSITLLTQAMLKTGIYSFEHLARAMFGRGGDIIVAVLMWLLCFGGAVGYLIAVGDIFTQIFGHPGVPHFLQTDQGRRCIVSAVWLCFMLPLVLPKKINSLRYASAAGVCFIVLFVICIIWHSAKYGLANGIRDDLVMVSHGNDGVSGLSIFMFSYLCQVNVGRILAEATTKTTWSLTMQAILSCAMCGTLYFLAGFFGYVEFGPGLSGNIIKEYNPYTSPIFFVVFIGLIVKLCAAFSLNMLACRTALFSVVHWDVETMPYWKHTIVSVTFAVGALILGLFVPDINIVFGLVGSFCGGFIAFIFPALFVMYAGNWSFTTVGVWYYLATYFLLICGVIAVVFGTGSSIYSAVMKYS